MATAEKLSMSLAEFLAWEENQELKYEFDRGEVFAMTGGTFGHAELEGNIYIALRNLLRPRGCSVTMETLKVVVEERVFYPDVVVECRAKVELSECIAKAPTILVEVLSESTEMFDKGKKWENYQKIASLQAYVLIAQDRVSVECYERNGHGWRYTHWTQKSEVLVIESMEVQLPLTVIYEGVDVPEG